MPSISLPTAVLASAAIAGTASLASGAMASGAASKAAGVESAAATQAATTESTAATQAAAQQQAAELQAGQIGQAAGAAAEAQQLGTFSANTAGLQPYITAGLGGLSEANNLLGLTPSGAVPPGGVSGATQAAALAQTPGYQFTLQQGLESTQNSFAAEGLGSSGAALKGAATFATGLASQTYEQQLQNYLNLAATGQTASGTLATLGVQNTAQAGAFGVQGGLAEAQAVAGAGAAGATGVLQAGQATAAGQVGSANAQAQGIVGSTNALTAGISGVGTAAQQVGLLTALTGSGMYNPTSQNGLSPYAPTIVPSVTGTALSPTGDPVSTVGNLA